MNRGIVENLRIGMKLREKWTISTIFHRFSAKFLLSSLKYIIKNFVCMGTLNQTAECSAPVHQVKQYLEKSTCLVIIIFIVFHNSKMHYIFPINEVIENDK